MHSIESLELRQLHPHIGVEVTGIDIRKPLSEAVVQSLKAAFNEYAVLVFRQQFISDEEQIAFSRYFGELEEISFGQLGANNKYIYQLTNTDPRGNILRQSAKKRTVLNVNARWHSDSSFKANPAMASILSGREIPTREIANTDFASMQVGYETLPTSRKRALVGRCGVHHYVHSLKMTGNGGVPQAELDALPPVQHPLVRVHPGNGRPSLFVSGHIETVVGPQGEEGVALAEALIAWCTRDAYVYSHEWQTGDLVMWDNRAALHRAAVVPQHEVRRVHRTTVVGEGSVEAYKFC